MLILRSAVLYGRRRGALVFPNAFKLARHRGLLPAAEKSLASTTRVNCTFGPLLILITAGVDRACGALVVDNLGCGEHQSPLSLRLAYAATLVTLTRIGIVRMPGVVDLVLLVPRRGRWLALDQV
jgi:hypothetical protein